MAKKLSYKVSNEEENESYFVSMSDIFAGVLFIFLIIIVLYYNKLKSLLKKMKNIEIMQKFIKPVYWKDLKKN